MKPAFDVPGVGRIAILRSPGGAGHRLDDAGLLTFRHPKQPLRGLLQIEKHQMRNHDYEGAVVDTKASYQQPKSASCCD